MLEWIIELLINAAILLGLASLVPGVKVRSYSTAIGVSIVIGLLNATIGALLRFPLNLITFFLLGFLVKLIVTAVVIRITDKFFSGFETRSFSTALILAVLMAFASMLVGYLV
jgi:putative membrane protein